MPEDPQLFERAITAELIKIEKDIRKLNECLLVLIQQTIQGNKLAKKAMFVQFNIKDLTDNEVAEEFEKVKKLIESHSDETAELAKKLMLGSP